MNNLLLYLIQASFSISVFYLAYEILFKHEAYFKFIRYYFLIAVITSTLLPLTHFSIGDFVSSRDNYISVAPVHDILTYTLDEVIITAELDGVKTGSATSFSNIANIILIIYVLGVIVSLLILFYRLLHLVWLIFKNQDSNLGKIRIIHLPDSPVFSFFNVVFLDRDKYLSDTDSDKIIAHESIHISQKHTLDILMIELLLVIQWFNPFVYLIRKRIKENHEFLADNSIMDMYSDSMDYYKLLVEHSTSIKTNILTHNFSYSLLKRRLFMIKRSKSPGLFAFKMIGVIIALSMVVYACSGPVTNDGTDLDAEPKSEVFKEVEVMPEYNGGMDALVNYLSESIKYPFSAKNDGVEGKSIIKFVVDEDGSVINAEVVNGFNNECDAEALRVVSSMPNWKPGQSNGKNVKVSMTLPISFKLNDEKKADVFTVVEVMPEYPGGSKELMKYIASNVKYPEEAKKNEIQGRVFVSFVVEKDGAISDVKVLRGIGGGCDKEAVRVIQNMPNWKPGTQSGKPVRVAYNIPINFKLS